jgi:hypothetical protein
MSGEDSGDLKRGVRRGSECYNATMRLACLRSNSSPLRGVVSIAEHVTGPDWQMRKMFVQMRGG